MLTAEQCAAKAKWRFTKFVDEMARIGYDIEASDDGIFLIPISGNLDDIVQLFGWFPEGS